MKDSETYPAILRTEIQRIASERDVWIELANRREVEIERLKALGLERQDWRSRMGLKTDSDVSALTAEIERLRIALRRYGDHRPACEIDLGYAMQCGHKSACTCGFDAALAKETT